MSNRHGKNRFLLLLAAVAAAGFLLRLIVGLQLIASDPAAFAPSSVTDMATYKTLSEQILQGIFPNEFYYQPFYYAVFLPLIQILTGPSNFMVILAQSLCGGFAILLKTECALRHKFQRKDAGVLPSRCRMSYPFRGAATAEKETTRKILWFGQEEVENLRISSHPEIIAIRLRYTSNLFGNIHQS